MASRAVAVLAVAASAVAVPAVVGTAPAALAETDCKAIVLEAPYVSGGNVVTRGKVECNGRVAELDASGLLTHNGWSIDTDGCGAPGARVCHVTPVGTYAPAAGASGCREAT